MLLISLWKAIGVQLYSDPIWIVKSVSARNLSHKASSFYKWFRTAIEIQRM